ncbi:UPF0676 protein [Pseudohyphozyma bogoriensis]|nr:UPF0676 protein [Pseudohyphozyma bogoriensis]
MSSNLPIIDFAEFGGVSEESHEIATKLYEACREVGFAYLSKRFFYLSEEEKMQAPHPPEGWKHRGFSGVGLEQISATQSFEECDMKHARDNFPDYKETFDLGREDDVVLANVWPPEELLPGFRSFSNSFYNTCRRAQLRVLRALAMGYPNLNANFFDECHKNADNQLRLLHYPAGDVEVFKRMGRCAPHTHNAGHFIPAPPMKGAAIFNLGDFLAHISNDTLKSTMHRVRAPTPQPSQEDATTPERFSIAYFCGGDRDTVIDVLPGSYGPDQPKKYEPISVAQYIDMRMNALYSKPE